MNTKLFLVINQIYIIFLVSVINIYYNTLNATTFEDHILQAIKRLIGIISQANVILEIFNWNGIYAFQLLY